MVKPISLAARFLFALALAVWFIAARGTQLLAASQNQTGPDPRTDSGDRTERWEARTRLATINNSKAVGKTFYGAFLETATLRPSAPQN